jgi:hypothetical protein
MKTATKITKPVLYRGVIVRPTSDGFDLINPETKQWAHFPTQRYAEWSATFIANITARFNANANAPLKPKQIPNVQEAA